MKLTYKLFLIISLSFLTFQSCDDAIDITQPGRLDADAAFQNVGDLQLGLFGAYRLLDALYELEFTSIFTDEISIGFNNGGQGLSDGDYTQQLNSDSDAPKGIWATHYAVINAANRVIEAAGTITPESDEDQELYNSVLGQALCLRAYSHSVLQAYFSTDTADDGALGVILVNEVPSIDEARPRNTNAEVYASIAADLNRAKGLLTDNADQTFIDLDFITALEARIALYRGNYAEASSLASSLIAKYPLATIAEYPLIYTDESDAEVIFKIDRTVGDKWDDQFNDDIDPIEDLEGWVGSLWANVNATIAGNPFFECSRSTFNLYSFGDIRLETLIDPSSLIDPDYRTNPSYRDDDVLVMRKYPGSNNQPLMNDIKVFRVSEMYLIVAEAAALTGDFAGAAEALAAIRSARTGTEVTPASYGSEQEALTDVLLERRLELMLEGHRYLDLKRLGVRAGQGVDRDPTDCQIVGVCTLPASDYRFTMPIPLNEQNGNSVIKDQQNPGYN